MEKNRYNNKDHLILASYINGTLNAYRIVIANRSKCRIQEVKNEGGANRA
jgi:hypothetical protein